MSNSYPLLAIARKHDVPYGQVLCFADWVAEIRVSYWSIEAYKNLPRKVKAEIIKQVYDFERSRNNENAMANAVYQAGLAENSEPSVT